MKISILSDLHFGYAYNSELENDSFDNADEAVQRALNSDLILLCGDIFDSRIPKTSSWARAVKILTKPLMKENTGVKLVDCTKQLKEISQKTLKHLPVIAIHGTHERRGRDEVNTVEVLENAGILIHLHCHTIVLEKDGRKIAIHGMSGVPERYAEDVLKHWSPQPIQDCFNILLLHQSIEPYVYSPLEPPTLNLSNLPKGFDLIIDGHIHSHTLEKTNNTTLIIPGSTVVTQLEKNEAQAEKGFVEVIIDSEIRIDFTPLQNNRKFFYEEIKIEGGLPVREQIERRLSQILNREFTKLPLVKLRVIGKETEVLEQELRDLERKYSTRAIISFVKELESPEITQKIEFLRNLREQKMSVEEIGLQVLKSNLDELKFDKTFDQDTVFKLLSDGETDRVFNILTGEQSTLTQILSKSLGENR